MKIVANNKKALFNYHVLEKFEAGIMLYGSEVKSALDGGCQLKDSYIDIVKGELFLFKSHISQYSNSNDSDYDPDRTRKLLMHRHEIDKILGFTKRDGLTVIPLKMYFKRKCKIEIGICKGKKLHDKRRKIMEKESKKQLDKTVRLR